MVGSDSEAAYISGRMLEKGVFAPPALYPAVPPGKARIRFTISATHSIEQLEKGIMTLAEIMREAARPAPVYTVGGKYKVFMALFKILPAGLSYRIVGKMYS